MPPEIKCFYANIAGTSHQNDDGEWRDRIAKKCQPMDSLVLEHDSKNKCDENAIKVSHRSGKQIGYVPRDIAKEIIEQYCSNGSCKYSATVLEVKRDSDANWLWIVNFCLFIAQPVIREKRITEYVRVRVAAIDPGLSPDNFIPRSIFISHVSAKQKHVYKTPERRDKKGRFSSARSMQNNSVFRECFVSFFKGIFFTARFIVVNLIPATKYTIKKIRELINKAKKNKNR